MALWLHGALSPHLRQQVQAHGRPVFVLWVGLGDAAQLLQIRVCHQQGLLCGPLQDRTCGATQARTCTVDL